MLVTGSPGGRTIINTVAEHRAERHGVGHDRPRGGRRAAIASPVAAGSADDRRRTASHRRGSRTPEGDRPRRAGHAGARARRSRSGCTRSPARRSASPTRGIRRRRRQRQKNRVPGSTCPVLGSTFRVQVHQRRTSTWNGEPRTGNAEPGTWTLRSLGFLCYNSHQCFSRTHHCHHHRHVTGRWSCV